jgi:hypothetical protein
MCVTNTSPQQLECQLPSERPAAADDVVHPFVAGVAVDTSTLAVPETVVPHR